MSDQYPGADGPRDPNSGATPGGDEPRSDQPRPEPAEQSPGRIERQEPGVTRPRPPTVAEARARDKARRRAEEEARVAEAAEQAKRRTRKRVMMGGAAVVGVAALVGGGYLAYRAIAAPDRVTAYCTVLDEKGNEVVVDDDHCEQASRSGSTGVGGILLLHGTQYRYYYGGPNTIGKPPTGGTTVKPKGAEIKTKSGTVIQRGGLGSRSGGST